MNYLAHIFLSGSNRKVQLGNFVGDAVKGSSYKNYPPDIAKGIQEVYPEFLSFPPYQLPLSSATVQTFYLAFYPDRPFAEIRHSERNKRVFEHHGGISSY